jgi:hypothetical protein
MNGSAGRVAGQAREIQRFGDDPLAGERGIAVNENRHRDGAVELRGAALVDASSSRSRHPTATGSTASRWLGLGGIVMYICPSRPRRPRARVVLHVTHPTEIGAQRPRSDRIFELRENLRVRLVEHVRQHVEPATMRHGQHRVPGTMTGRAADDFVEDRHEHVEPLEREAVFPGNVRCRNRSNTSTCVMRSSTASTLCGSIGGRKRPDSAACRSQSRSSGTNTCA